VELLVVQARDVAEPLLGGVLHPTFVESLPGVHLDDADVDSPQVHDVPEVLKRAASDHGKDAQVVAVEHIREVGGDSDVGAVCSARDHTDRTRVRICGCGTPLSVCRCDTPETYEKRNNC
jgi:hypothetical protein